MLNLSFLFSLSYLEVFLSLSFMTCETSFDYLFEFWIFSPTGLENGNPFITLGSWKREMGFLLIFLPHFLTQRLTYNPFSKSFSLINIVSLLKIYL